MSLILVKNKNVANLTMLHSLALKKVFDEKHMRADEERLMEESIIAWAQKINILGWQKRELEDVAVFLFQNSQGMLQKKKDMLARHKIDYKKMYRGRVPCYRM